MAKDENGDIFRVDHAVKQFFEKKMKDPAVSATLRDELDRILGQLDNFTEKDFAQVITKYEVLSPSDKRFVSAPEPFNLMFATPIGPTGNLKGFALRIYHAIILLISFQLSSSGDCSGHIRQFSKVAGIQQSTNAVCCGSDWSCLPE